MNSNNLQIIGIMCLLHSVFILTGAGPFFEKNPRAQKPIAQKLGELIHAYGERGLFSGSALVAQRGKIILSKGYGMADYGLKVPNTPHTKFRLASVTKQFAALAILQLQERGLIKVTDTLSRYLPDFPQGDLITILHLLNHRSGIMNFGMLPDYPERKRIPTTILSTIDAFKDKPLEFTPGEKYSYSNSNYIILAALIEKVSGMTYQNYLKKNIFDVVGMSSSGAEDVRTLLSNKATGYTGNLTTGALENADYIDLSCARGAGDLYSTIEDLFLWDRALYTDKLIKASTLSTLFHTRTQEATHVDYAYGWLLEKLFGKTLMWHDGIIDGFRSMIYRFVDDDVCIILLGNTNIPSPLGFLANALAACLFGESYVIPHKRNALKPDAQVFKVNSSLEEQYVGSYQLPNLSLEIVKKGDQLFLHPSGQPEYLLIHESESTFYLPFIDVHIAFVKNSEGIVTELISTQEGSSLHAPKAK